MSKLSFRARALDAGKPMPIYMAEELPDLPDFSAINRAVPQMPSGMQKEEECEHHLQRAIVAGLIIPTPEVSELSNRDFYEKIYPSNYKQPRQLIHMQPFTMEQDIPDYDMDSDDERWLHSQTQKLDLSPMKFEEMMDRLEKSSGQTVVTLNEAKALLKEDDDLIIAVFDYWLNKRLKTQHPLILTVKTEHRSGTAANNPYLAFRRRTEKMQTRKNRKNDEASYEKMLKLRRDLFRAVTLLELVKRREKIKREHVHLTVEVFEKRYQARDFSGSIINEASAVKPATRPAFAPLFRNHYTNQGWSNKAILKDEVLPRREKRQYKKRKHKSLGSGRSLGPGGLDPMGGLSSDEDSTVPQLSPEADEVDDEGQFTFRRNKSCSYHMPLPHEGNWPWCSREEHGFADKRFRFTLTSLSNPRRCIGFARRRVGRGGRVILDRVSMDRDDFWRTLDFSIIETNNDSDSKTLPSTVDEGGGCCSGSGGDGGGDRTSDVAVSVKRELDATAPAEGAVGGGAAPPAEKEDQDDMVEFLRSIRRDWLHFRPKTPPQDYEPPCDMLLSQDTFFTPGGAPFSMEIQPLEPLASGVLMEGTSPLYVTDPFVFEQETPVTDTRQNTLMTTSIPPSVSSSSNSNSCGSSSSGSGGEDRTIIGCSSFNVVCAARGSKQQLQQQQQRQREKSNNSNGVIPSSLSGSVSTSPKLNSVNATMATADDKQARRADGPLGNTNGLLAQFGFEVPSNKSRNNKLSYAYSGAVGYPKASPGTLSLHTSAHTVTLNSHSANLLDLPIADDEDGSKLTSDPTAPSSVPTNNKTKTIVRKNNIIMEVT